MRTPLIERILNTAEINKILVEKLLNGYEKGQTEGDSIHIINTANLPMFLAPKGQIVQDSRIGHNLLNLENEGQEISLEYTAEYNLKYENCKIEQTLKPGTYTLALKVKSLANGSINGVSLKNVDTTVASFSGYTATATTESIFIKTITIDTDVTFNRISIQNGQVGTYMIKDIMILDGTYTTETLPEYEAFGKMPSTNFPSPIKKVEGDYNIRVNNRNLAKIETLDINWRLTESGITNLNRNAGVRLTEINLKKGEKFYINFKLLKIKTTTMENDMTFTGYINGVQTISLSFGNIQRNEINNTITKEYTANEDCTLSYILWGNVLSETFEFQFWITKEPDTDYIKVQQQNLPLTIPDEIKLYGENDGFVYLTKEQATELELDEGWYVVNNYKERNFSKEPLLTAKTAGPFSQGYYLIFDDIKNRASLDGNIIYSTHQKQKVPANPPTDVEWLKMDGNLIGQLYPSIHIGVYINYAPETKQEFVDWFNNLAPIIIYPIKKPVYTKITDKHFIKQLEDLQKVFSHEGITNIDTYSTDSLDKAPLILSVEYLKSQKIINKNLDERITNLEVLLLEQ